MRIGVLALQGAFREHIRALHDLDVEAVEVRRPADLDGLDGLIMPGGESTSIRMLMRDVGLDDALRRRIADGLPVLGTCAGLILLADRVDGSAVEGLNALDADVRRNAFGRQVDSFEEDLTVASLGDEPVHAVFIRAPVVDEVDDGVEVLARLPDGRIVGVRQRAVVGLAFHPELTADRRFHRYFLDLIGSRELVPSAGG